MPKVPSHRAPANRRTGAQVQDPVFVSKPDFFDPRDLAQVKYEMLRRHYVDQASVVDAARGFGFSRQGFYFTAARFGEQRMLGLLPGRPGPKGPRKVTDEMASYFASRIREDPAVHPEQLAEEAAERFGTRVHPRTVRRRLERQKKTAGVGPPLPWWPVVTRSCTRMTSCKGPMKPSAGGAWQENRSARRRWAGSFVGHVQWGAGG